MNYRQTMRDFGKVFETMSIVCLLFSLMVFADETSINPSTTCYATRGLTQTSSAETMGEGRMTVNAQGSWYQQARNTRFPRKRPTAARYFYRHGCFVVWDQSLYRYFRDHRRFGLRPITRIPSKTNRVSARSAGRHTRRASSSRGLTDKIRAFMRHLWRNVK